MDFINYEYFSMAKSILKSPKSLNNIFDQNNIKIIECKKNRNNLIDESVNQTTALMFENMQIDHYNIMEFILYLKQYINLNNIDENNNYKISKIRQYNNRILIIFDYIPNCIKKLIRKGENEYLDDIAYYNYKGKNVPIIPKMKPILNLGKYKEKNVKISIHCLNQEDKKHLFSIFDKNNEKNINENYMIEKMAEKAYNNICNKDKNNREDKMKKSSINRKREREKDKNNDREKEKDRNRERERERNSDKIKDRKRDKDRKKDREYERRNQNDRDEYSIDKKKESNNDYKNNLRNDNNNINNSLNNINNNINGLNINEKDLNQVASLFSNSNAMNLVKYLIDNNIFNNISNNNNNNNMDNNNDLMQKKLKINQNDNNSLKNNFNDVFNNTFNPNNLNINNQQLLNLIQSQGNFKNQQQRMNNMLGNNLNSNYQNMMNMNAMMNIDNNLLNNNYFNNTRQFPFNMNEQYINQFGYNQQKRKDNNK